VEWSTVRVEVSTEQTRATVMLARAGPAGTPDGQVAPSPGPLETPDGLVPRSPGPADRSTVLRRTLLGRQVATAGPAAVQERVLPRHQRVVDHAHRLAGSRVAAVARAVVIRVAASIVAVTKDTADDKSV
jgi:hypothetical protein